MYNVCIMYVNDFNFCVNPDFLYSTLCFVLYKFNEKVDFIWTAIYMLTIWHNLNITFHYLVNYKRPEMRRNILSLNLDLPFLKY